MMRACSDIALSLLIQLKQLKQTPIAPDIKLKNASSNCQARRGRARGQTSVTGDAGGVCPR
jgi:hypothetical protein